MPGVRIRAATPADAPAIARVHVRSWQAVYRGQIPDRVLDNLSIDRREQMWSEAIARQPRSRAGVWVAESEGAIVGFAAAGPTRDSQTAPSIAEVYAIYLEPALWDQGIGRTLFAHAIDSLRTLGFEEASLWVLATNSRARRFYEVAGWRPDGAERNDTMEAVELHEVRYRVNLSGTSSVSAADRSSGFRRARSRRRPPVRQG